MFPDTTVQIGTFSFHRIFKFQIVSTSKILQNSNNYYDGPHSRDRREHWSGKTIGSV